MRILFVDDNREICELYQLALRRQGVVAHLAYNGHEAVSAVAAEPKGFDVIVLDVEMPLLDGWGAFEAIRQLPHSKDVPIVMFTGYATPEHQANATKYGAAAFLTKPTSPDDLVCVLRNIVEKRQQTASE